MIQRIVRKALWGLFFFAFFEKFFVPILTSGGLAAVSSSAFAALYSAFGKYDVVHIHAEGPAFFAWLPKMLGKRVVVTVHGIDWQREKWQSGLGSKFIHQGEKNAVKYADEVIVLSKGVQDYFKKTYDRETHFIPNGVNRPQIREAKLITDKFGLKKDSYILFLGRLVPEKGIGYQGSTVLDEPEREAGTTSIPIPQREESENIPLPDLSFRLKKMNKVPSRLKSVQLDITSIWSYNTSKWT